ncbi:hypothetical protein JOB18_025702, partial [Solea senegalensis]
LCSGTPRNYELHCFNKSLHPAASKLVLTLVFTLVFTAPAGKPRRTAAAADRRTDGVGRSAAAPECIRVKG